MAKTKQEIQEDYLKRTGYSANNKYNKEKTVMYAIRAVIGTEQDIIQRLESVGNKSGYIKRLIREDIERNA
jgi:hypothetical protein